MFIDDIAVYSFILTLTKAWIKAARNSFVLTQVCWWYSFFFLGGEGMIQVKASHLAVIWRYRRRYKKILVDVMCWLTGHTFWQCLLNKCRCIYTPTNKQELKCPIACNGYMYQDNQKEINTKYREDRPCTSYLQWSITWQPSPMARRIHVNKSWWNFE